MRSAALVVLTCLFVLCGAAEVPAGQLRLSWDDNSADEAGFIIERRSVPEELFQEVARTGAAVNAFDDVTVEAGTPYCYRVLAFNAAGVSSPSNEACGTARLLGLVPRVRLDLFSVPQGREMIVTATLTPGVLPIAVDAYIVVVLPDGTIISIGEGGAPVLGIAPIVSGVPLGPNTLEIVRYTFVGDEPIGSYRWYGAVAEAGTLTLIGDISAQTFEFPP